MNGNIGMRALSALFAVLLVSVMVHVASADVAMDPGEKLAEDDGQTLAKELSIRIGELGSTGGVTVVDITGKSEHL
jgi:hypothetical protein